MLARVVAGRARAASSHFWMVGTSGVMIDLSALARTVSAAR